MSTFEYPDEYIDKVFHLWHDNGRGFGKRFFNSLEDFEGKKPTNNTINDWIIRYGWIERADALDAQIALVSDDITIQKRRKMIEEAETLADELIAEGRKFLSERHIQTDASAIRAIDLGINIKFKSVGIAELYAKISQMSNDDITKELKKLLGQNENEDSIEGEIIKSESDDRATST